MEIDVERWTRFQQKRVTLHAQSRGLVSAMIECEQRLNRARIELTHAEEWAVRTPLIRPAAPRGLPPGAALPTDALVDSAERREADLADLCGRVFALDREYKTLDAEQAAIHSRLTTLNRLDTACRQWCAAHGVTLPDAPSGPGMAHVQDGPPGRQFAPQAAAASAGKVSNRTLSSPASASFVSAARTMFDRFVPSLPRRA